MTPQDNWQQELDRLARLQGQLERQQREAGMQIESLKMDADALKREVDWQLRDRDWRVQSLERFRDFIENLIMYGSMIACGIALFALIIIIVVARDERRERAEPEERPLSSMEVLPGDDANGPVLALRMDYRGLEN